MKEINHVEQTWKQNGLRRKTGVKERGREGVDRMHARIPRGNCDIATLCVTERTRTGLGSKTDRPSEPLYGLYGLTNPGPTAQ